MNLNVISDGVLATVTSSAFLGTSGTFSAIIGDQLGASSTANAVALTVDPPLTITVLNPCDLNGDGKVDAIDTQYALDIDRGIKPYDSLVDIDGDGLATVIDFMRVNIAALGQTCKVGK